MTRKCKYCKSVELPPASKCGDIVEKKGYCSIKCLADHQAQKRIEAAEKKKKAEFNEMKERVNSQGKMKKAIDAAQAAFNAFIRERDAKLPCISCGTYRAVSGGYAGAGGWDAGHYRSRGACPELRFNEDNCFKQCVHCNRDLSGNVVEMRKGILERIGQERLDIVEGPHEPAKFSYEDLKEIQRVYKQKLKDLKAKA